MKKLMLLACGLLIALTQAKIDAQTIRENTELAPFSDTLFIKLKDGNKILITGAPFKKLIKYAKADSLKMLFLSDYEKGIQEQTIPANTTSIHYFVHPTGKRRMKAETAEYSDSQVDVDYEIKRLDLDLPRYQYNIYDLARKYTIQIYVANPDQLKQVLSSVSINDALTEIARDKEQYSKNFKLEVISENNGFRVSDKIKRGSDMLWAGFSLGAGLFGNTPVPVANFGLTILLNNKYDVGISRYGLSFSGCPLVEMTNGEVQTINYVQIFAANYLWNLNKVNTKKESWFGFELGLVRSSIGSYNGGFMTGIIFEPKGSITYSFRAIYDKHNNGVPFLTVMLPF
jgi:hypothetical protein